MQCSCVSELGHMLWVCVICGAYVAEDCADPSRWGSVTTPAGLHDELRWTVPGNSSEQGVISVSLPGGDAGHSQALPDDGPGDAGGPQLLDE